MDLLSNIVGLVSLVFCIYMVVKHWDVLTIDSSIVYRIMIILLCVLMFVLSLIFILMLIAMFGY